MERKFTYCSYTRQGKLTFIGSNTPVESGAALPPPSAYLIWDISSLVPVFSTGTSSTSSRPGYRGIAIAKFRAINPKSAKMVYDWDNKEDICYRMYIEEKKSLEEIMEYMKEEHKFTPRSATPRTLPYPTVLHLYRHPY